MPNKKFWDNSSLQQDIEWGNQTLPGITDEELYNTNWNLKKTASQKQQAQERSLELKDDIEWQTKQAQAQEKRAKSGWESKMVGNKNGAGKRKTKIVQPEHANQSRSKALVGIERPNLRGVPKPKLTCPHCGKVGGKPQMIQYHFDKCKHKPK
jgi:hypothetical protein